MDAMVKEMLHKKAGHRENINSEHRLKMLLDQYMDSTMHLQDLYEDKDGQRKEEVCEISDYFKWLFQLRKRMILTFLTFLTVAGMTRSSVLLRVISNCKVSGFISAFNIYIPLRE